MKTQTTEIIKIVVGILVGTLLVVGAMWFMAGGVIFLPFFVVIFLIFMLSVIVIFATQKRIILVGAVGGFVFGWIVFDVLDAYICNPKEADVKVMTPMAQKISEYIITNGIPKSLQDIPDLPYKLKKCKSDKIYADDFYGSTKRLTKYTQKEDIALNCRYEGMRVGLRLTRNLKPKILKWSGELRIESWRGTRLWSWISEDEDGKFSFHKFSFGCDNSGMCRTWKFIGA